MPGHASPVSNKTELASSRDMLVAIRPNVAKLKQQDRSLDETIAAKPTEAFDAKWGQFLIIPAFFTKLVDARVRVAGLSARQRQASNFTLAWFNVACATSA